MYKIFIVEDDELIAAGLKHHLESWDYAVVFAQDLANVMTEFVHAAPQLVLMDIKLPFYNGYYWCSEIRKVSKVPIIFLSSAADNMNIVMAVNMGGDDFIAKPFDLDVLTVKIQAMLRRTYDFEELDAYLAADDMSFSSVEENDIRVTNCRQKQNELFRIEQYVDMALQYMRLGAEANDFVFENVMLDEVIKLSIHKYARQFIHKQLRLTYTPQDVMAVTDKKWLGFVIDQLLSNAVKYTKQGGVTIRVCRAERPGSPENVGDGERSAVCAHCYDKEEAYEENARIVIEDTGIGIRAEDLPRVCEKGYTGYNGHADKYSTGIGLYLCQAILDKLGHPFLITSEQGKGTKVEIIIVQPAKQ